MIDNPIKSIHLFGEKGIGRTSFANKCSEIFCGKNDGSAEKENNFVQFKHSSNMVIKMYHGTNVDSTYYNSNRSIDICIIMFDLSDKTSFEELNRYTTAIEKLFGLEIPKLLVGTKSDLGKEVSDEEIEIFKDELDLEYFEVSINQEKTLVECLDRTVKMLKDIEELKSSLPDVFARSTSIDHPIPKNKQKKKEERQKRKNMRKQQKKKRRGKN